MFERFSLDSDQESLYKLILRIVRYYIVYTYIFVKKIRIDLWLNVTLYIFIPLDLTTSRVFLIDLKDPRGGFVFVQRVFLFVH
jgi:hypothetical protein